MKHLKIFFVYVSFFLLNFLHLCADMAMIYELLDAGLLWGVSVAVIIIFLQMLIITTLSAKWYLNRGPITPTLWAVHVLGICLFYRSVQIMILLRTEKEEEPSVDNRVSVAVREIRLIHYLRSFLLFVPLLVLQTYLIENLKQLPVFTVTAAVFSAILLFLSLLSDPQSVSNFLTSVWSVEMLIVRITALLLLLIATKLWFFLFFGIHWLFMFVWFSLIDKDASSIPRIINRLTPEDDSQVTKCLGQFNEIELKNSKNTYVCFNQDWFFNAIAAVVFCFSYFDFVNKRPRWRFLCYYAVIMLQNVACLTAFLMTNTDDKSYLGVVSFGVIVGGTIVGCICLVMFLYFDLDPGPLKLSVNDSIVPSGTEHRLPLSDSIVIVEESDLSTADNFQENYKKPKNWDSGSFEKGKELFDLKHLAQDGDGLRVEPVGDGEDVYEAVSSVMSAHDYENMAAVNIARGTGLRHWRPYTDIQLSLHDYSVVTGTLSAHDSSTNTATPSSQTSVCDDDDLRPGKALDTILEDGESSFEDRQRVCALVATIDQIRISSPMPDDIRCDTPSSCAASDCVEIQVATPLRKELSEGVRSRRPVQEGGDDGGWQTWMRQKLSQSPFRLGVKEMQAKFLKQVLTPRRNDLTSPTPA